MSGRRILAMTRKEVIQIRRDPLSLMIIIAMPHHPTVDLRLRGQPGR